MAKGDGARQWYAGKWETWHPGNRSALRHFPVSINTPPWPISGHQHLSTNCGAEKRCQDANSCLHKPDEQPQHHSFPLSIPIFSGNPQDPKDLLAGHPGPRHRGHPLFRDSRGDIRPLKPEQNLEKCLLAPGKHEAGGKWSQWGDLA